MVITILRLLYLRKELLVNNPAAFSLKQNLRWLYLVFLVREAWVQIPRAGEYLKKRKTTKINMVRLLSRFAIHLPPSFLSRTSVRQKTARNVLKNILPLTSPDVAKLRSQYQQFAVLIAPTSEREGCDRKRRK